MPRRDKRRRLSGPDYPIKQEQLPAPDVAPMSPFAVAELEVNDDEAEKRQQRERERAKRKSMGRTPGRGARQSARSRAESPFAMLSQRAATKLLDQGQLGELYSKCVQLSQHGKINQQNAWSLQLVDYLTDVVQLDRETNFQKASHTIDAASKIYGSRVDSVHKDTYKILSSIHQSGDAKEAAAGDDTETAEKRAAARRSRNRNMGRATLVTNTSQITEVLKNLVVEVDPMFHKTSSAFDEGGARGLLMNQLLIQNGTDIVFDSSTVLEHTCWKSEAEDSSKVKMEDEKDDATDSAILEEEHSEVATAEMEEEWLNDLVSRCFTSTKKSSVAAVPGVDELTQMHEVPGDLSEVDLKWISSAGMCPETGVFLNAIDELSKGMSVTVLDRAMHAANDPIAAGTGTQPVGDVGTGAVAGAGFYDDSAALPQDDFDFANFDDVDLNANDLFADDFDIEVHGAMREAARRDAAVAPGVGGSALAGDRLSSVDGTTNYAEMAGSVARPLAIHPRNADLQFDVDSSTALASMVQQRPDIERHVNLSAMNAFIEKLEHSDMDHTTAFFDTSTQQDASNWAGPSQWYKRRYQLTLKKQQARRRQKAAASSMSLLGVSTSAAGSRRETDAMLSKEDADYDPTLDAAKIGGKKPRKRKLAKSKMVDFMAIAKGNFLPDSAFDPPQRSNSTMTDAAIEKCQQNTHRLPSDKKVKPNFFIQMFCKPDYSVWRHWLRTYQARAKVVADRAAAGGGADSSLMSLGSGDAAAIGGAVELGRDGGLPTAAEMQALCNVGMAVEDEDLDPGFYNYDNDNDEGYVAALAPKSAAELREPSLDMLYSNWNDDADFELIDAPSKVQKLTVEFTTTAKKVDVRNLKLKMWERLRNMPRAGPLAIENEDPNAVTAPKRAFSDVLTGVGKMIEPSQLRSVSVPFCFICVLHLANEKGLSFEAVDSEDPQGDFNVFFEDESHFVKEEAVEQLLILGGRN